MGSCYFPYKLSYITFGRPEVKFVQSGFNQRKREERSFAPQNILKKKVEKRAIFSCSHDAFRFTARSRESGQSRKRSALGHLFFRLFGPYSRRRRLFHSLTELPVGMACKSDFFPPNILIFFFRERKYKYQKYTGQVP